VCCDKLDALVCVYLAAQQTADVPPVGDIVDAHVLLYLGDSVSTDQISLAGSIAKNTPAARYLAIKGYATSASASSAPRLCYT